MYSSPAAAAAKSLQLCPTLCNPIDGSPPGSPIPGILLTYMYTNTKELIWFQSLAWGLDHSGGQLLWSQEWTYIWEHVSYSKGLLTFWSNSTGSLALMANLE